MDILTNELNLVIRDTSLHIAVRAAAACGRVILDKYYSRTDESVMYRMAMSKPQPLLCKCHAHHCFVVLHPQFKTEYFEDEHWEREWIDTAKEIITEQWTKYYKTSTDPAETVSRDAVVPVTVGVGICANVWWWISSNNPNNLR